MNQITNIINKLADGQSRASISREEGWTDRNIHAVQGNYPFDHPEELDKYQPLIDTIKSHNIEEIALTAGHDISRGPRAKEYQALLDENPEFAKIENEYVNVQQFLIAYAMQTEPFDFTHADNYYNKTTYRTRETYDRRLFNLLNAIRVASHEFMKYDKNNKTHTRHTASYTDEYDL